ncbi:hypothetical protein [Flavobacterium johnsoniae]|nr:hypothetical protein [Flavobacterium johnsoniae]
MKGIEKIRVLIVGLTTVLSLINFSNSDFKKEVIQDQVKVFL